MCAHLNSVIIQRGYTWQDMTEYITKRKCIADSGDGLPTHGFEKSLLDGSPSQDPTMFSTLLQSEMRFEQKHIEDWVFTINQTNALNETHTTPQATN